MARDDGMSAGLGEKTRRAAAAFFRVALACAALACAALLWPAPAAAQIRAPGAENVIEVGGQEGGVLMLTSDENLVEVRFRVAWGVEDVERFETTLAEPEATIEALAMSAMQEAIGKLEFAPLLVGDRTAVSLDVQFAMEGALAAYDAGVRIYRVMLDRLDAPREVIDDFLEVQAAEQERALMLQIAERYFNETLAVARRRALDIQNEAESAVAEQRLAGEIEAARFRTLRDAYRALPDAASRALFVDALRLNAEEAGAE